MVKGGQVGWSLRSMYQDLGIPMKIEIQSDSSTANSLGDRLGAGQRTKHTDTRYFWILRRLKDGDLSLKKVLPAKNCADAGTKPVSASVRQQHCKFAGDSSPGTHTKRTKVKSTEIDACQRWSWTSRRMCKLSETSEWWTSLSASHDARIMSAIARSKAKARSKAMANTTRNFEPGLTARLDG